MAYNVLKGNVEGSVDQHADQEIDGIKVFKNTISASVFYDTDAQSPCATENNVAIKKITGSPKGGVITYIGDKEARAHFNLTFDGKTLVTDCASFKNIAGDASGLHNIPSEKLIGKINGERIECGNGIESHNGALRIKKSDGIVATNDGLALELSPNGALTFKNGKVLVDPSSTLSITTAGQNISDNDTMLLYDASRGDLRHTTFENLYSGYINIKAPKAAGSVNAVQFKGTKSFSASDNFTYDSSNSTLNIKGTTKSTSVEAASHLKSNGTTEINGALYKAIKTISESEYNIQDTDNTILIDISKQDVLVVLPLAKENYGRVINIKVIVQEDQKYKIRSSRVAKIKTSGELIDFTKEIVLKSNYSSRTLHSDGTKWWVTNANGS